MNRNFYIVTPTGARATESVGRVLGRCSALHVAVALCHSMSEDLTQASDGTDDLVIVESHADIEDGECVPRRVAVRVFGRDGTRM